MSLATNIKEFADILHNVYAEQLSSLEGSDIAFDSVLPLAIPKAVVLQQVFLYAAKSFSSGVFYFLSFQWLRDFSYFPLISPENGDGSLLDHDTFLSEPFSYLFSFAKNGVSFSRYYESGKMSSSPLITGVQDSLSVVPPTYELFNGFLKSEQILAGLVNSFFFSLPFSLPHLITLRRLFSQGVAAAAASIFGTVTAHFLVVAGVLYGIRFLIVPYYSLQPLTFCVGTVTVAIVITEFVKEKRVYLVPLTHYPSLFRIGVLNFVVALCESATVFHDLHHLTLNQHVSYLQLYESQTALDFFLTHTVYLVAFLLGHGLFSLCFTYLLLKLAEKTCSLTGWTLPQTARRINRGLLVLVLTLTFSSFPYYGLDYLFTKSAGFLPEDPAYRNTIFSPTQVRSKNRHFKSRAPTTKDSKTPLELDVNYFDRGMYLNAPKEEKTTSDGGTTESSALTETTTAYDPALTFEELNYQGESAWLMRHERARRLPEEQDSKKESIFQKPKTHFKQLRLKEHDKRAEIALKESAQIGSIPEAKEGSTPRERFSFYNAQGGNNRLQGLQIGAERGRGQSPQDLYALYGQQETLSPQEKGEKKSKSSSSQSFTLAGEGSQDRKWLLKELAFEKEIASNYEKSFTSPFGDESDGTPPDLIPVENIIKKRYRLNPVYRALLQTDIDFFVARQPAHYKITQNQEASLFQKRQLLEKYYNSIRYYSPVESAGFTKKHQAHLGNATGSTKGVYKTELDTLSARSPSDKPKPEGLVSHTRQSLVRGRGQSPQGSDKRDAPEVIKGSPQIQEEGQNGKNEVQRKAYETFLSTPFTKSFNQTTYHQQFKGTLNTVKRFFKLTFDEQQNLTKNRVLSYDQPLYKNGSFSLSSQKDERYHPSLHEELHLEKISPFVEESNSAPIYAGWDDKARRFVITNRFNFVE